MFCWIQSLRRQSPGVLVRAGNGLRAWSNVSLPHTIRTSTRSAQKSHDGQRTLPNKPIVLTSQPGKQPSQKRLPCPCACTPRPSLCHLSLHPSSHTLPELARTHQLLRSFSSVRSLILSLSNPITTHALPRRSRARGKEEEDTRGTNVHQPHGRADGLAARRPRQPPTRLLLRLHLQEPQTVSTSAAPASAAAVLRSSADGARGGGGAPAAGGPPAAGRAGGGRRARHPGGDDGRPAAPGHHGRPLRLHALGGLPRLAVAPRAHRPGRDHRAQEAAQTGRRRRRRRGLRLSPSARRQVAHPDQDRRAHRGAEEAGEGVVQGQALQRGVHPAGAGRHGVRRRRAQHLAPHGEALPGPAPLRRRRHHRALGGRRGAGARDAEGERDGQEPAHRAQHRQRPALHLADPHGARDRRQGLRVHQMAMSELPMGSA